QIKLAWILVYSKAPSKEEIDVSMSFIKEQTDHFSKNMKKNDSKSDLQSLSALCQGLLISNRFLYVD
ncbi:hypothetical protein EB008_07245, partial [bacterium]|nr:hypothetical protein [bacterium]